MQDFRKLLVWQRAHAFAIGIRARARTFPRSGYTEFRTQIIRAADSIANNIVEGCAAATRKEFARFLDISIKSASEVEYQLQAARDDGVIGHRTWWSLTREVREIRRMIFGLRRTVLSADEADEKKREERRKPRSRRVQLKNQRPRTPGRPSHTPTGEEPTQD